MASRHPSSPIHDDDLDGWERELAAELARLRTVPVPASFAPEPTRLFQYRLELYTPRDHPARAPRPALRERAGRRLAAAALAAALAFGGTGYAAAASLPGDPLFPLKSQAEELRIRLAPDGARAELRRGQADERLQDIEQLVERGAPAGQVASAVLAYEEAVARARAQGDDPQLRSLLDRHAGAIAALAGRAPQLLERARDAAAGPRGPAAATAQPRPTAEAAGDEIPGRADPTARPARPAQPTARPDSPAAQPDQPGPRLDEPTRQPERPSAVPEQPGGRDTSPGGPPDTPRQGGQGSGQGNGQGPDGPGKKIGP